MAETRPSIADKRRAFQQLHEVGCFVIPNPWDVGSARFLQSLGFKALATTSSGFAWSQGCPDGAISRDMALAHLQDIVAATDLPVNADFESGFALDAAGVAESVRLAVETGVAGLSIEDSTGDAAKPLYELSAAVERIRAARRAIDKAGGDTLLVGRAECFLVGRPDLDETIGRLKAYAQAGADCLYAPGIRTRDQIAVVSRASRRSRSIASRVGERAHDAGDIRARGAASQRWRCACALSLGWIYACCQVDCGARQIRWVCQRGFWP
jgi:2-methylisocitrate lyase-like PEP mutase family enzyme